MSFLLDGGKHSMIALFRQHNDKIVTILPRPIVHLFSVASGIDMGQVGQADRAFQVDSTAPTVSMTWPTPTARFGWSRGAGWLYRQGFMAIGWGGGAM